LLSDDLPRAAAFYEDLGFVETFRTPADGEPIHVDPALDDYRIGIASGVLIAWVADPDGNPVQIVQDL
jgi:catechol 2,3-dioxygenase-like lactoylglutathione lyase family enzyme